MMLTSHSLRCYFRLTPVSIIFLSISITVSAETERTWHVTGIGNYLEAKTEASALVNSASFKFDATLSSAAKYRIEVAYEDLRDVIIFDGSNTIVYRMINTASGIQGSDIVVLKGPFPAMLPGYLQSIWMGTYLNLSISKGFDTNALSEITKSTFIRKNFGEELANQAEVRELIADGGRQYGVFMPGNATRDGHRMFMDAPYKNGVMFQRLRYTDRRSNDQIYRNCETADCVLYRDPLSSEDVRDLDKHVIHISSVEAGSEINLNYPKIAGKVWVSDYSLLSGTNATPMNYNLSRWSDLPAAQQAAIRLGNAAASHTTSAKNAKLFVILFLATVSVVFLLFLLKQGRTRSVV